MRSSHRLVRGLDYYTRTTFEFQHGGLGAQNALLGGGRYDGLSEMIGGPKAPGIGFAIGADRLVLTLEAQAGQISTEPRGRLYRTDRRSAEFGRSGAGARTAAGGCGSRWATAVSGSRSRLRPETSWRATLCCWARTRLQSGILTVKNFATGEQTKIAREALALRTDLLPHE